MGMTVELPLWLLLVIVLFAAVTASTHLLFPSVRWFFRRRAERLVARLNERLERPIQPFKLLRRQDMIQRVIYDPDVVRAVTDYAAENNVREDVAFEKAKDYAREIVPSFSASAYFGFAIRAARWLANAIFEVRLHRVDEAALQGIEPDATVVFVMNHRSNFDYVLVTYLAAEQSALSYAVGEWARVWPLSRLIRAMGAYFIRRQSRNALYRKVLGTYVQKATEAGVTQAVFPEGGLSRDGRVGEPKLGILSYIAEGWQPGGRDVVFVPVALNYDRVVEDRVLVEAERAGTKRFRGSIAEGIRFSLRYLGRRITGKVGRFGVAGVVFGRPVSLAAMATVPHGDLVATLARRLRDDIRAIVPLTTVPLLLRALSGIGGSGSAGEVAQAAVALRSNGLGGAIDFSESDLTAQSASAALDVLVLRHILARDGDSYRVKDPDLVAYYSNSIDAGCAATAQEATGASQAAGKSVET